MSKLSNKILSGSLSVVTAVTMLMPVTPVAYGQTVAELQAQIAALLAQITTLQTQLGGMSTPPASSMSAFTRNLTTGDSGADVTNLQTFLKDQGASIYPEGLVTGYFGALTSAAVKRFQDAHAAQVLTPLGLTAGTGYFGASTRALVNSMLTTVTPPTPTPTPVGATPTPVPTATPVPGSGLTVSLNAGNPAGTTVISDSTGSDGSQIGIEVLRLTFAAGAEAKVTSLKLRRWGVSADTDFANAYLYEGNTRLSDSAAVTTGVFTWSNSNGLFTVPAGGSRSVSVLVDLANDVSAGKTFMFGLEAAGDLTSSVAVAGTYPVRGNEFRTAQVSDLGNLNSGTVVPSGATNVDAGTTNYELLRIPLTAADQNVEVSYLKLSMIGSADYDALQNLKLYVDGSQVGSTVALMNTDRTLVFDLTASPFRINSGLTKQLALRGDVVKGSGRTFRFRISEAIDLRARDVGYNVSIKLNESDVYSLVQAGGDTSIQAGSLTVTKRSDSPSSNVAFNATNVKLASYDWKAVGEDIKISTVTIRVASTTNDFTNIKNVKLLVGGSQIGTTVATLANNTDQAYSAGSSFVVPAGTTKVLDVYADIQGTDLGDADAIQVSLRAGVDNALRMSAGTTFNAPGSNQSANALTVSAGTVGITRNSSVANMTVVANAQNVLIGSWLMTAPTEQGVDVNSITVRDNSSSTSDVQGVWGLGGAFDSLILKSGGTQYGQTVNSPSSASGTTQVFNLSTALRLNAGQSTQVDLYANVLSSANTGWFDTDGVRITDLSGTGIVANNSVGNTADVTGQQITIEAGATLTVSNEVSPTMPDSTFLVAGDSGVTLAAWKFAVNNSEDVNVTRVEVREGGSDDLPGNAKNIKLYVDGVQVGTTVPAFTNAANNTALFENTSGLFTIPKNTNKTVQVRADLTDNTNASFVADGAALRGNLSLSSGTATATTNVSAKGSTSGQYVTLAAGAATDHLGSIMKVVKTRPVFARCETSGSGCSSVTEGETLVPGTVEVFRFSVTAHSAEDVVFTSGTHNLRFTVTSNPSSGNLTSSLELFDASNDSSLGLASGNTGVVDFTAFTTTIPKGTTKTYYVKANLSSWTATGASFQLSLKNAAADVSFSDNTTSADIEEDNFVGWGLPLDGEILVKP